jgi:hypothetical protein
MIRVYLVTSTTMSGSTSPGSTSMSLLLCSSRSPVMRRFGALFFAHSELPGRWTS